MESLKNEAFHEISLLFISVAQNNLLQVGFTYTHIRRLGILSANSLLFIYSYICDLLKDEYP
jgi:hypothetical protein